MITFIKHDPRAELGYLPSFLSVNDPRRARDQIDRHYQHGGGWQPFKGFKIRESDRALIFPGDPPMKLLASARLRDEMIYLYDCSWVAIVQKDGSFEAARID